MVGVVEGVTALKPIAKGSERRQLGVVRQEITLLTKQKKPYGIAFELRDGEGKHVKEVDTKTKFGISELTRIVIEEEGLPARSGDVLVLFDERNCEVFVYDTTNKEEPKPIGLVFFGFQRGAAIKKVTVLMAPTGSEGLQTYQDYRSAQAALSEKKLPAEDIRK